MRVRTLAAADETGAVVVATVTVTTERDAEADNVIDDDLADSTGLTLSSFA